MSSFLVVIFVDSYKDMKFFRLIVLLAAVGLVIGSNFFCNKSNWPVRSIYHRQLKQGGVLYVAVSYLDIGRKNLDSGNRLIVDLLPGVNIPLTLLQSKSNDSTSTSCLSIRFGNAITHWCGFYSYLEDANQLYSSLSCGSKEEHLKAFFFKSALGQKSINDSERFLFHACRMQIDSNSIVKVEKSLLILDNYLPIDDQPINEDDVKRELINSTFENLHYDEFHVEDFCVCNHIVSYINECPEPETIFDLYVLSVIALLCVVALIIGKVWLILSHNVQGNNSNDSPLTAYLE